MACIVITNGWRRDECDTDFRERQAPPRRYDDETLSRMAALSSTVKCECPRHLAELIASLSGFERYSAECESRSPRDAALHAYLHATASQARHMIENALDHVIEIEDINLSGVPERSRAI